MLGFRSLAVAVTVAITVAVSVGASGRLTRIPAVQYRAEDSRSVFGEPLARHKRRFAHGVARANDEHYAIGEPAEKTRIREVHHWRSVDDDHVEVGAQAGDERLHARRVEKLRNGVWARSAR